MAAWRLVYERGFAAIVSHPPIEAIYFASIVTPPVFFCRGGMVMQRDEGLFIDILRGFQIFNIFHSGRRKQSGHAKVYEP
jgi:hypothetical protein